MNILITGAGLIGSHCARQAVDAGNQVVLFDLSPNRDYLQKVVGKDRARRGRGGYARFAGAAQCHGAL